MLAGLEDHFSRAEHHLRGILDGRRARQPAGNAAVGQRFDKHCGKGRAAAGDRRARVLEPFLQREEPSRARHAGKERVQRLLRAVFAARVEDHALAHGRGHIRHDADHGICPARKLPDTRHGQSRRHADEHGRFFPRPEHRRDTIEHVRHHLRLDAEKQLVRPLCRRGVIADRRADARGQRLRLFRRAVGKQDLRLAALCRGACQRAAHVARADKSDLHNDKIPFSILFTRPSGPMGKVYYDLHPCQMARGRKNGTVSPPSG